MRPEPARHGLRPCRGSEPRLRVPGGVPQLWRCGSEPRPWPAGGPGHHYQWRAPTESGARATRPPGRPRTRTPAPGPRRRSMAPAASMQAAAAGPAARPTARCPQSGTTAGVQLRLPVRVSGSKMGDACPP
ncbi:hypothetical protein NDU88_007753 [Pleurodeles waltl]|uniref:Uncharacterized protein n=1 Tax=Pleurodeles waltl TaxID=8319 RepID=A0AAV7RTA6_PLEWA|nr:hypothetical protein NDU88_007753 [Pleurodeles waltl]